MPLEIRPGSAVPIPCRHCGRSMIRFTVAEGKHTVSCSKCGAATVVHVELVGGALQLRTEASRPKPGR